MTSLSLVTCKLQAGENYLTFAGLSSCKFATTVNCEKANPGPSLRSRVGCAARFALGPAGSPWRATFATRGGRGFTDAWCQPKKSKAFPRREGNPGGCLQHPPGYARACLSRADQGTATLSPHPFDPRLRLRFACGFRAALDGLGVVGCLSELLECAESIQLAPMAQCFPIRQLAE